MGVDRIARPIIEILVMAVLLSGCTDKSSVYSDEYMPEQDSQYYYKSNINLLPMADTSEGFFFIDSQFVYYKDKMSGEVAPVCNKPECLHNDNTCNAYLQFSKNLMYNSGKLYYLHFGAIDLEGPDNDILLEMSTDGSGHKELISFSEYVYQISIHRNFIYFITTDFGTTPGQESKTTMDFYRVPLEKTNAEPELLYTLQGINANISHLLCYGNYIYFYQSYYTDMVMDEKETQMNRYNIQEGSVDTLSCSGGGQYTIFNNKLAFSSVDGTYLCDLDGEEAKKISDQYGILLPSNQYLLVDTIINSDVLDRKKTRSVNAFNQDGEFIGSVELDGYRIAPVGIVDDKFIVPYLFEDSQFMTVYSIPVDKIANSTGTPQVFFEK